jgi:hypothetical protein
MNNKNKNILCICGSLNQTTMMHKISRYLNNEYNFYFTPYYATGLIGAISKTSLLDFSVLGGQFRKKTLDYLKQNNLQIDIEGKNNNYDLIFTCSDLIIPSNIKNKSVILVQEGMTDPENFMFYIVKALKLPRWMASTSTTGLSDNYDLFCVASEGYKQLFIQKGVKPEKILVTGIPNFDNCRVFLNNSFPHKNFVLAATSDTRETYKFENRKNFIRNVQKIANGRKIIFKLHPNEDAERNTAEIKSIIPDAIVYRSGKVEEMIANCDVLITRYSSVVYVGLALNKEVYSAFDINKLRKLMPIQNDGQSAFNIALAARQLIESENINAVLAYNYKSYIKSKFISAYQYLKKSITVKIS